MKELFDRAKGSARNHEAHILLLVPILALSLWSGIAAVNIATSNQSALFDLSINKAAAIKEKASEGFALKSAISSPVNQLVLSATKDVFMFNGQPIQSVQPMVYKRGYAYVPMTTMAQLYGLDLAYDSETKETIVSDQKTEVRFRAGSRFYTVNGTSDMMEAPAFTQKGNMMIPLSSWADFTGSELDKKGRSYSLTWNVSN